MSATFRGKPNFFSMKKIFFLNFLKLLKVGSRLVLAASTIKTHDLGSQGSFFFKKVGWPTLGDMTLISATIYIFPCLADNPSNVPIFGHF